VPRSLTLFYSSYQAAPRGTVALDVWDSPQNTQPPDTISIRLKRPDGSWMTFTTGTQEIFYAFSAGDTLRIMVQFDATGLLSGAYGYTAVITGWWGSVAKETAVPVRVLVLNERNSGILSGWTVASVQTLIPQGDTLVALLDGAGGIVAFDEVTPGVFRAPRGEFTEVHKTGTNTYVRIWSDSTKAFFSPKADGAIRVDSIRDRFGNVTRYEYFTTNGKLRKITDPMGYTITLAYSTGWNGLSTVNAAGRTTILTGQAGTRDLLAIKDPDGLTQSFTYDSQHRMLSATDREGATTDYEYDVHGKLKRVTLAQVTLWNGQNQRPTIEFVSPEVKAVPVSSRVGSLIRPSQVYGTVVGPRGDTTRTWFDGLGQPVKTVDAMGRATQNSYEAHGLLSSVTLPSGQQLRIYWLWSNPLQKVIPVPTQEQIVGLRSTTYSYDTNYHFVKSVWQDGELQETYYYSPDGRRDSVRVGSLSSLTKFYSDARGRDTAVVNPEGHRTRYIYDSAAGNLAAVVLRNGQVVRRVFDAFGRVRYLISPTADTTEFVYDALNRVTAVYDPLNPAPTRTYYGPIYADSVKDQKGETYRFVHDALGWVTERYGPASANVADRYGYDAAGNVVRWTNRNGQTIAYTYDLAGRVTRVEAPDDTLEYGYDPLGKDRFKWAKNAWSMDTTWFSPWGAVDSTVTVRGGALYRVGYEYAHWSGQPTKVQDWYNNRALEFTYSALGQLDTLKVRGLVSSFTALRDAELLTVKRTYPALFDMDFKYTTNNQVAEMKWGSMISRGLGYDELGRVVLVDPEDDSVYAYSYDELGRLKTYQVYGQTGPCAFDPDRGTVCSPSVLTLIGADTFTYDATGNRVEGSFWNGQVDPGNRLVTDGWVTYTYDAAGNVTRRQVPALSLTQDLYWSALGQLDSVVTTTMFGGTSRYRFEYDALGRRIERSDGTSTVKYVWAMGHVLFDIEGATVTEYAYWPGTDRLHSMYRNGKFYYYLTDHLGSVLGVADAWANLLNRYEYDPWGEMVSESETVANRFGYAGRELDATGFFYLRNRYYDSETGRFLSEDPLGLAGGLNPYTYAANSPVTFRDPFGLDEDDATQPPDSTPCSPGDNLGFKCPIEAWGPSVTVDDWWAVAWRGSRGEGAGGYGGWASGSYYSSRASAAGLPEVVGGSAGDVVTRILACTDAWRFSNNFAGIPVLHDLVQATEIVAPISFGADMLATFKKIRRPRMLGTRQTYASGMDWAFRRVFRSRPGFLRVALRFGDKATPALWIAGLFTLSYNATIAVECAIGVLE
jgi:RHS repeat-associated protein